MVSFFFLLFFYEREKQDLVLMLQKKYTINQKKHCSNSKFGWIHLSHLESVNGSHWSQKSFLLIFTVRKTIETAFWWNSTPGWNEINLLVYKALTEMLWKTDLKLRQVNAPIWGLKFCGAENEGARVVYNHLPKNE